MSSISNPSNVPAFHELPCFQYSKGCNDINSGCVPLSPVALYQLVPSSSAPMQFDLRTIIGDQKTRVYGSVTSNTTSSDHSLEDINENDPFYQEHLNAVLSDHCRMRLELFRLQAEIYKNKGFKVFRGQTNFQVGACKTKRLEAAHSSLLTTLYDTSQTSLKIPALAEKISALKVLNKEMENELHKLFIIQKKQIEEIKTILSKTKDINELRNNLKKKLEELCPATGIILPTCQLFQDMNQTRAIPAFINQDIDRLAEGNEKEGGRVLAIKLLNQVSMGEITPTEATKALAIALNKNFVQKQKSLLTELDRNNQYSESKKNFYYLIQLLCNEEEQDDSKIIAAKKLFEICKGSYSKLLNSEIINNLALREFDIEPGFNLLNKSEYPYEVIKFQSVKNYLIQLRDLCSINNPSIISVKRCELKSKLSEIEEMNSIELSWILIFLRKNFKKEIIENWIEQAGYEFKSPFDPFNDSQEFKAAYLIEEADYKSYKSYLIEMPKIKNAIEIFVELARGVEDQKFKTLHKLAEKIIDNDYSDLNLLKTFLDNYRRIINSKTVEELFNTSLAHEAKAALFLDVFKKVFATSAETIENSKIDCQNQLNIVNLYISNNIWSEKGESAFLDQLQIRQIDSKVTNFENFLLNPGMYMPAICKKIMDASLPKIYPNGQPAKGSSDDHKKPNLGDWDYKKVKDVPDEKDKTIVYNREFHVVTPEGEPAIVRIDMSNHGNEKHAVGHHHFYIYTQEGFKSDSPEGGVAGLPYIDNNFVFYKNKHVSDQDIEQNKVCQKITELWTAYSHYFKKLLTIGSPEEKGYWKKYNKYIQELASNYLQHRTSIITAQN